MINGFAELAKSHGGKFTAAQEAIISAAKSLAQYELEDGMTISDFRQRVADDLGRADQSLINKGEALCSCRGRTELDESEAKFVQLVVEAF
ncbi:hypothetical protein MTO96_042891 [Rhipicephalus appendiculatus]